MESVRQYKISNSANLPFEIAKTYPNGKHLYKIYRVENAQPPGNGILTAEEVRAWEKENVPQLEID